MSDTPRQLHLAVAVYGVGGPGQHGLWKDPRVPRDASIDIKYYIRTAQLAEQALFDALFIVDSQFINATYPSHYLNRLEPLTLLSAVATHTSRIGLVGTVSSTYNSPFNLARRFASLDEHLDYATWPPGSPRASTPRAGRWPRRGPTTRTSSGGPPSGAGTPTTW